MAICVYDQDCTDFGSNGLGLLTPTECKVTEELNGAWEISLKQPVDSTNRWAQLYTGAIIKLPVPVRDNPIYDHVDAGDGSISRQIYAVSKKTAQTYSKASTKGTKYELLKKGAEVVYLETPAKGWYKVCVVQGGQICYVQSKCFTFSRNQVETVAGGKIVGERVVSGVQSSNQLFRIYFVETNSDEGIVTVKARHIFYDLMHDVIAKDCTLENVNFKQACETVFAGRSLAESDGFDLTVLGYGETAKTVISGEYGWVNPTEALLDGDDGLITQAGAVLVRDNYSVAILPDEMRSSGVTIRRGKQLSSVKVTVSSDDVVTRIIPVGKNAKDKDLFIDETYVDSPYIDEYHAPLVKKIDYDVKVSSKDVDNEKVFKTEKEAKAKLKELAQADFDAGCDAVEYGMTVDFVPLENTAEYAAYKDLQTLFLGDTARVIDSVVAVDATVRMTGYEWDALSRQYSKVTLGEVESAERTVNGSSISSGSVSGSKLIRGTVSGDVLRTASIQYAKIGTAAIEQLAADAITAVIGRFSEITSGSITTDELYAQFAKMETLVAKQITSETISTDELAAELARIQVLVAGTASFDKATIQHLVANAMNLKYGVAGKLFITNLAVDYAQMVSATIGNLVIRASDGNYYHMDVAADGTVTASQTEPTDAEKAAGQTSDGRVITETQITASQLNTSTLFGTYALINKIDAARIDVDTLMARQAFIDKLYTSNIYGGKSIKIMATDIDTATSTANTAKSTAESASTKASSAETTANSAKSTAESAASDASSAKTTAASAVSTANSASTTANNAKTTAESAASTANTAKATADSASTAASSAQKTANSASTAASNAQTSADNAASAASKAQTTANSASTAASNAQTAADNAASAASAAQTSADSAASAASKAQTTADSATATANSAKSAADTATSTANTAKSTADAASTKATSAETTANSAKSTADSAASTANTAKSTAESASTTAATAKTTADEAKTLSFVSSDTPPASSDVYEGYRWLDTGVTPNVMRIWMGADVPTGRDGGTVTQTFVYHAPDATSWTPSQSGSGTASMTNIRPLNPGKDSVYFTRSDGIVCKATFASTVYGGSINSSGVITRTWGYIELSGNESWEIYNSSFHIAYYGGANYGQGKGRGNAGDSVFSHGGSKWTSSSPNCNVDRDINLQGFLSTYSTVDALKTYLKSEKAAGHPLEVAYYLSASQTVSTTIEPNVLTVDNTKGQIISGITIDLPSTATADTTVYVNGTAYTIATGESGITITDIEKTTYDICGSTNLTISYDTNGWETVNDTSAIEQGVSNAQRAADAANTAAGNAQSTADTAKENAAAAQSTADGAASAATNAQTTADEAKALGFVSSATAPQLSEVSEGYRWLDTGVTPNVMRTWKGLSTPSGAAGSTDRSYTEDVDAAYPAVDDTTWLPTLGGSGEASPENVREIVGRDHAYLTDANGTLVKLAFPETVYGGTISADGTGTKTYKLYTIDANAFNGYNNAAHNWFSVYSMWSWISAADDDNYVCDAAPIKSWDEVSSKNQISVPTVWDTGGSVWGIAVPKSYLGLSDDYVAESNDAAAALVVEYLTAHPIHMAVKMATATSFTATVTTAGKQVTINNAKSQITSDVTLTVTDDTATSATVTINGTEYTVTLTDGEGTLTFTPEADTEYTIESAYSFTASYSCSGWETVNDTSEIAETADAAKALADEAAETLQYIEVRTDGTHMKAKGTVNEMVLTNEGVSINVNGQTYSQFAANYVQFGNYRMYKTNDGGLAFKLFLDKQ